MCISPAESNVSLPWLLAIGAGWVQRPGWGEGPQPEPGTGGGAWGDGTGWDGHCCSCWSCPGSLRPRPGHFWLFCYHALGLPDLHPPSLTPPAPLATGEQRWVPLASPSLASLSLASLSLVSLFLVSLFLASLSLASPSLVSLFLVSLSLVSLFLASLSLEPLSLVSQFLLAPSLLSPSPRAQAGEQLQEPGPCHPHPWCPGSLRPHPCSLCPCFPPPWSLTCPWRGAAA